MRFFYTLIASGLLILTEIPAEQPPPFDSYQDIPYAVSHELGTTAPHDQAVNFDGTREVLFDPSGEWYIASSPTTYLGAPEYLFPNQLKQTTFAARVPPEVERGRLQDGPELLPLDLKESPTPLAKTATVNDALATYREPSELPVTGYAMFYNPNVMQEVLSNRLAMGHVSACGECIGNVALLRAGDLNRRVWLQWPDGVVEGPFLVADVAASHHVAQLLARNWVVDVDNRTAVRRRMAGPVLVTVWASPPPASQLEMPPFAPLYSEMAPADFSAMQTPAPTLTPLPALNSATPIVSAVVQGGFPTETPVPTMTPLPVINATSTATTAVAPSVAPTQTPLPTQIDTPTFTPVPTLSPPVTTSVVTQSGFPTDTPVPTITPLPAIEATPTAIPVATTTPTVTAIVTQTSSMTATLVVTQGGFPTDTPVPTITPLPAINPPTPTPTVFTN